METALRAEGEAIQFPGRLLDCFVALLLAMTVSFGTGDAASSADGAGSRVRFRSSAKTASDPPRACRAMAAPAWPGTPRARAGRILLPLPRRKPSHRRRA